MREKMIFCMYGCFSVSRYIKEGRKLRYGHIAFLGIHVCKKNRYWKSSGIIIFLCNYYRYLSYTDGLLDVFFLLLSVTLSEFYRNQEEDIELQKKVYKSICVRDIPFLAARPPSYVIFVTLCVYYLFFV